MSIFVDDFNFDNGWVKTGSWVDSAYSIANGVMTITAGVGGAGTSAYTRSDFISRNAVITVRAGVGVAGYPQIHLREASATDYLVVYINPSDGTFNIGKFVAGVYTSFGSTAINSFNANGTYTFSGMVFENCLHGTMMRGDGSVDVELESISADVNGFIGMNHGIGLTSTTQKYDWVEMRILNSLVNVVAVGDSNVGPVNRLKWPEQMVKRRIGSDMLVRNKGVGGYSTQDVIDGYASLVTPFRVIGARNVMIVGTGNNDFAVETKTAAQAHAKQRELILLAQAEAWECQLNTLIPFEYAGDPLTFVQDLNTLITGGKTTYNYISADIYTAFGATNGSTAINPTTLRNADGIHYTNSGHNLAAKTILYTLARNDREVA